MVNKDKTTKNIEHQGVNWIAENTDDDDWGDKDGYVYRCEADRSIQACHYAKDGGIFAGWCLLSNGCVVLKSSDPNVTLEECLSFGNSYASARVRERHEKAEREMEAASEALDLIEHISPLGSS